MSPTLKTRPSDNKGVSKRGGFRPLSFLFPLPLLRKGGQGDGLPQVEPTLSLTSCRLCYNFDVGNLPWVQPRTTAWISQRRPQLRRGYRRTPGRQPCWQRAFINSGSTISPAAPSPKARTIMSSTPPSTTPSPSTSTPPGTTGWSISDSFRRR